MRYFRPRPFGEQKLYKSRMSLIERSTKAGWFSLKALWKQDDFHSKLCESLSKSSKSCGKIAYLGCPSFCRRPWPFGDRQWRNTWLPDRKRSTGASVSPDQDLKRSGLTKGWTSNKISLWGLWALNFMVWCGSDLTFSSKNAVADSLVAEKGKYFVWLCSLAETSVHGPDWAEWKFIVMFLKKQPQSKSLGRHSSWTKPTTFILILKSLLRKFSLWV